MITLIGVSIGLVGTLVEILMEKRIGARHPAIIAWWYGGWMVTCVAVSAIEFASGQPGWGIWMAACAAINGYWWWKWHNRRKRKRAMALLGAKSRALIAKLVIRQREAHQPAP
jgi:hypothetical protein